VIKVEQPLSKERDSYPVVFEQTNRGKKSVEIDLKGQKDRFLKLVSSADVVIEGNRPGVMERLGLGYDVLRLLNPRLIYVALTGYGSDGPCASLAGHDVNYLAMSGVLATIGPAVVPNVPLADLVGGSMQVVIQVLLAIHARHRIGAGQRIDVSMTDGSTALLPVPRAGGIDLLSGRFACYHVYAAADGSHVAVGALETKFWTNLCRELGYPELIERQLDADQAPLLAALTEKFSAATAEEWFERIGAKDCCVTPVRSAAHGAAPQGPRAPRLGEHNEELL
jgi:crotonobetainyl-CoA:carnitine CoA-transferase CaiB-like acyl-CoA transferase